jgi:hypothetical protein
MEKNRMKYEAVNVILVVHDRVKLREAASTDAPFCYSLSWLLTTL